MQTETCDACAGGTRGSFASFRRAAGTLARVRRRLYPAGAVAAAIVSVALASCAPQPSLNATNAPTGCGALEAPASIAKQPNYRQVIVAAEDKDSRPLPKLGAKELRLYQNGKPVKIVYFQSQAPAVGILVDTSASMQPKLPSTRQAVETFIRELDPDDQIFLFAFSGRPFLLQAMTTDHVEVIGRLKLLHAYGRTALYDSLMDGMIMLSRSCVQNKAIFVITDGMDNASGATVKEVAKRAAKVKIRIFAIGIGSPTASTSMAAWLGTSSGLDPAPLRALAKASNGEALVVDLNEHGKALKQATRAIARRIDDRYVVGFIGNGSSRNLRIEAPHLKGTTFRIEPENAKA